VRACAGELVGTIYKLPARTVITNDSLVQSVADNNTIHGKFPPSFRPAEELTVGSYQAIFNYYPVPNQFTMPFPLNANFSIVVRPSAAPFKRLLPGARAFLSTAACPPLRLHADLHIPLFMRCKPPFWKHNSAWLPHAPATPVHARQHVILIEYAILD
jgi:hypothetical protein